MLDIAYNFIEFTSYFMIILFLNAFRLNILFNFIDLIRNTIEKSVNLIILLKIPQYLIILCTIRLSVCYLIFIN